MKTRWVITVWNEHTGRTVEEMEFQELVSAKLCLPVLKKYWTQMQSLKVELVERVSSLD